jgi:hypothetical protein
MKKLGIVALVVVALVWIFWPASDEARDGEAADAPRLVNQVWVEKLPGDYREKFDIFVAIEDPDGNVGAFARSSAFEGDYSLFEWSASGAGRLDVRMLQQDRRYRVRATTREGGCGRFDYCLKLDGAPRGSRTYGSMREWVIDGSPEQALARARAHVRASLAAE